RTRGFRGKRPPPGGSTLAQWGQRGKPWRLGAVPGGDPAAVGGAKDRRNAGPGTAEDRSVTKRSALDECKGRLGALDRVTCGHVIGIAGQHEQVRVWDDLLPRPRLVHTGEPARLRRYDQCRASNLRYVAPDIGSRNGLHK